MQREQVLERTTWRPAGLGDVVQSVGALVQVSPQTLVGLLRGHHPHGVVRLQLRQRCFQVLQLAEQTLCFLQRRITSEELERLTHGQQN